VRVAARLAVAQAKLAADPAAARALLDEALAEAIPGENRNLARAQWVAAAVATGQVEDALSRLAAWLDTESDLGAREEVAAAAMRNLREASRPDAAADVGRRYASAGFEATMEAALSLREAGAASEAAALLRGITAPTAEDERWRRELLADALIDADELDAADEVWSSLAGAGSDDTVRLGRARVARSKGEYEAALRHLEGNADARAPEERGLAYEGLGRWEEAAAAYEQLAARPSAEMQSAGRVGQARVRLAQDDPAGALAALAKLSLVDPGYVLTVAQVRAEALLAVGRIDEARDVYAALDDDAEQRTVRALGLAECALAGDDARSALSLFEQARASTADRFYQAHAIAGLARSWAELGNAGKARAELDRLRAEYPEREDAIERALAAGG
jgi:tetratricopeptide (TPR) repeat protein